MSIRTMHAARANKKDEFYTRLSDIEDELRHYRPHFKDKVLYLNTDHPDKSNFYLHFKLLFEVYGLKKLITTFWSPNGDAFKTIYDGVEEVRIPLEGDGDFQSDECVDILNKSDIVVTNPPFSLFKEFIELMMETNVKFLVIGNNNAITYKEIFPLIKENKLWLGTKSNTTMKFQVPSEYELVEGKGEVDSEGNKYLSVSSISWFTNMSYPKRYEDMLLWNSYKGSEDFYPYYDNYNAINIDSVKYIPYDFDGVMGVPITFLSHWNPNQFEILGIAKTPLCFDNPKELQPNDYYENVKMVTPSGKISNTASVNDAVIKVDQEPEKTYYIADNVDGYLVATYARLLIRNLNPVDEIEI